jgi:hypothetical protein
MAGEDRENLVAFIRSAKGAGAADAFVVDLLKENGWSDRRIYAAFSDYYAQTTGAPIPSRGRSSENARDAFLYLVSFVSLAFWSIALIWLANIVIMRDIPNPADVHVNSLRHDLAGQLASIIIGFPIFMMVSALIVRQTRSRPETLESSVRKWLTYVALVIAAIALITDAVLFLASFLTGELTLRFALQYLVLIVVAGGIFWYYLGSVRSAGRRSSDTIFGWIATVGVLAGVVVGFAGLGTPAYEQRLSLDERRINDLWEIVTQLPDQSQALPATLRENNMRDPVTHVAYVYKRLSPHSYQLCATFDTADESNIGDQAVWNHPAGYYCLQFDTRQGLVVPDT